MLPRTDLAMEAKELFERSAGEQTRLSGVLARETDRRGVRFPILREWQHRSLIVNSLPTSKSDKQKTLDEYGVRAWHFIFTAESPRETDAVLRAFTSGASVGSCRRIAVK